MLRSQQGAGPAPREAELEPAEDVDPAKLLTDLLLGRAGPPTAAIRAHEIRVSTALVLGGVCLGLAGFAAIAIGQFQEGQPFALREVGGVLGGLGLLTLMWGILAGLPAHRTLRVVGLAGAVLGVVGVVAFVGAYPESWGRPGAADQTVPVLLTYVVGLVLLVAATFASLVADFVLRVQVRVRLRGELGREPTDEEIQRDIDEAMRRYKVSWGGVVERPGKGIRVMAEPLPQDWEIVAPKVGRETIAGRERAAEVDGAVERLLDFRGGRVRRGELPSGSADDAVLALRALRVAQEAAPRPGVLARLLAWLGLRPLVPRPPE